MERRNVVGADVTEQSDSKVRDGCKTVGEDK